MTRLVSHWLFGYLTFHLIVSDVAAETFSMDFVVYGKQLTYMHI